MIEYPDKPWNYKEIQKNRNSMYVDFLAKLRLRYGILGFRRAYRIQNNLGT